MMLTSNVRRVVERSGRFGAVGRGGSVRPGKSSLRVSRSSVVRGVDHMSSSSSSLSVVSGVSVLQRSYVTRERQILSDGFDAPPMIPYRNGPSSESVMTSVYDVKKEREQLVEDVKLVLKGEVPMNTLRTIGERQLSGASLRMWQRKVGDLEHRMRITSEDVAKDLKRPLLPDLETPVEFPDWITAIESVFRAAVYFQHEENAAHIPKTASFAHWNEMISDAQKREATRSSLRQNLPSAVQSIINPSSSSSMQGVDAGAGAGGNNSLSFASPSISERAQHELQQLRFRSAIESFLLSSSASSTHDATSSSSIISRRLQQQEDSPSSVNAKKQLDIIRRETQRIQTENGRQFYAPKETPGKEHSSSPLSSIEKIIVASSPFAAIFQHNPAELVRFQKYLEAIDEGREDEFVKLDEAQRSATIATAIAARNEATQHYSNLLELAELAIVRLFLIKKANAAIAIDTQQAQSLIQQLSASMEYPTVVEEFLMAKETPGENDVFGEAMEDMDEEAAAEDYTATATGTTSSSSKTKERTRLDSIIDKYDALSSSQKQTISSFRAMLPSLISDGAATSAFDAQVHLSPHDYTLWKQLDTVLERIQVASGEDASSSSLLISQDPIAVQSAKDSANASILSALSEEKKKSDMQSLATLLPELGIDAKHIPFKTFKAILTSMLPVFKFSDSKRGAKDVSATSTSSSASASSESASPSAPQQHFSTEDYSLMLSCIELELSYGFPAGSLVPAEIRQMVFGEFGGAQRAYDPLELALLSQQTTDSLIPILTELQVNTIEKKSALVEELINQRAEEEEKAKRRAQAEAFLSKILTDSAESSADTAESSTDTIPTTTTTTTAAATTEEATEEATEEVTEETSESVGMEASSADTVTETSAEESLSSFDEEIAPTPLPYSHSDSSDHATLPIESAAKAKELMGTLHLEQLVNLKSSLSYQRALAYRRAAFDHLMAPHRSDEQVLKGLVDFLNDAYEAHPGWFLRRIRSLSELLSLHEEDEWASRLDMSFAKETNNAASSPSSTTTTFETLDDQWKLKTSISFLHLAGIFGVTQEERAKVAIDMSGVDQATGMKPIDFAAAVSDIRRRTVPSSSSSSTSGESSSSTTTTAPASDLSASSVLPVGALAAAKLRRVFGTQTKTFMRVLNEEAQSKLSTAASSSSSSRVDATAAATAAEEGEEVEALKFGSKEALKFESEDAFNFGSEDAALQALHAAQSKAQLAMWLDFARDESGKLRNPVALYFPSSAEHPDGTIPIAEFMVDPHMRRIIKALAEKIQDQEQWPKSIQRMAGINATTTNNNNNTNATASSSPSSFTSPTKPFGDGIALKDEVDEVDEEGTFSSLNHPENGEPSLTASLLKGEVLGLSEEDAALLKSILPPERSGDIDALLSESQMEVSEAAAFRESQLEQGEDLFSTLEKEVELVYGYGAVAAANAKKRQEMLEGPHWRAATIDQRLRVLKTQEYMQKLAMQIEEGSAMIRVPKESEVNMQTMAGLSPSSVNPNAVPSTLEQQQANLMSARSSTDASSRSNSRFERPLPGEQIVTQVEEEQEYLSGEEARPILEAIEPLKQVLSFNNMDSLAPATNASTMASSSSKQQQRRTTTTTTTTTLYKEKSAKEDMDELMFQAATQDPAQESFRQTQSLYLNTRDLHRQERLMDVRIAAVDELLEESIFKVIEPFLTTKHKMLLDKIGRGEMLDAVEESEMEAQLIELQRSQSLSASSSPESSSDESRKVLSLLKDIEFYSKDLIADAEEKDSLVSRRDAAEKAFQEMVDHNSAIATASGSSLSSSVHQQSAMSDVLDVIEAVGEDDDYDELISPAALIEDDDAVASVTASTSVDPEATLIVDAESVLVGGSKAKYGKKSSSSSSTSLDQFDNFSPAAFEHRLLKSNVERRKELIATILRGGNAETRQLIMFSSFDNLSDIPHILHTRPSLYSSDPMMQQYATDMQILFSLPEVVFNAAVDQAAQATKRASQYDLPPLDAIDIDDNHTHLDNLGIRIAAEAITAQSEPALESSSSTSTTTTTTTTTKGSSSEDMKIIDAAIESKVRAEEKKMNEELAERKKLLLQNYKSLQARRLASQHQQDQQEGSSFINASEDSDEIESKKKRGSSSLVSQSSSSTSPSQAQFEQLVKVIETVSKIPDQVDDATFLEKLGFEVNREELAFWDDYLQESQDEFYGSDVLESLQGSRMMKPSSAAEHTTGESLTHGSVTGAGPDAAIAPPNFIHVNAETIIHANDDSIFTMAKRLAALTQVQAGGDVGRLVDSAANDPSRDPFPDEMPLAIDDPLHDLSAYNPLIRNPIDDILLKEAIEEESTGRKLFPSSSSSPSYVTNVSKFKESLGGRQLSEFDTHYEQIVEDQMKSSSSAHPLLDIDLSDASSVARYLSTLPDMFFGVGGAGRVALEQSAAEEAALHPAFFARDNVRDAHVALESMHQQREAKANILSHATLESRMGSYLEEVVDRSASYLESLDLSSDVKLPLKHLSAMITNASKLRESGLELPSSAMMWKTHKDYELLAHDLLSTPKSPEALGKLLAWATPEEMVQTGRHLLSVLKKEDLSEETKAVISLHLQLIAHPLFHGGDVERAKKVSSALPIPKVESPGVQQLFEALNEESEAKNEFVQIIHYLIHKGQLKEEEKTATMRFFEESAMRGAVEDAKYMRWLQSLVTSGDVKRLGRELTRLGVFKNERYAEVMAQLREYQQTMKEEMSKFHEAIDLAIESVRGETSPTKRMVMLGERIAVHEAHLKTDYELLEESGLNEGRKMSSDGHTLLWTKDNHNVAVFGEGEGGAGGVGGSSPSSSLKTNTSSLRYFVDPQSGFEYTIDLRVKKQMEDAKKSDWQRLDESVGTLGGISGLMRESMTAEEMRSMLDLMGSEEDSATRGVGATAIEAQRKYEQWFLTSTRDLAPVDVLPPDRPVPLPGQNVEDVPTLREYMLRQASLGQTGQVAPQTAAERIAVWQNGGDSGKSFWNAYDAVLHMDNQWDPLPALGDTWTLSEPNDPAIHHWTHFSRFGEGALCLKINPSKFTHDGIEFQVERVAILLPEAKRLFLSERVLNRINLTKSNENEEHLDALQMGDAQNPMAIKNQFNQLLNAYDQQQAATNQDPNAEFKITDEMWNVIEQHEAGEFHKMDGDENLDLLKPSYPLVRQRLFDIPHNLLISLKRVKWPHSQDLQSQYIRGFIPKPTEPDFPLLQTPGDDSPDTDPDRHISYLGHWIQDAHKRLRIAIEHEQKSL